MASAPAAPVVIFGAGKTGRGFLAHVCARAGRSFILVDRDRTLVAALAAAGSYPVENLRTGDVGWLTPASVLHVDDDAWFPAFAATDLCFTAVFGNNLPALGARIGDAVLARGGAGPLDIVTAENMTRSARALRDAVANAIPEARREALLGSVGFVEAMVLKTCLGPGRGQQELAIRAQDLFRLPCDGDASVGPSRALPDIEPLTRFNEQLTRKIFTYNCINAIISYVGAARGYHELSAAARDPDIDALATRGGEETSRGLVAEFGFDADEQRAWVLDALRKFRDPHIPDPIERNAADPARKLARDDRLVGPALLALKHGVEPRAIVRGIVAATGYRDGTQPSPVERTHGSLRAVLLATCGLREDEPLFERVVAAAACSSGGSRIG